jgi:hypothetical protein
MHCQAAAAHSGLPNSGMDGVFAQNVITCGGRDLLQSDHETHNCRLMVQRVFVTLYEFVLDSVIRASDLHTNLLIRFTLLIREYAYWQLFSHSAASTGILYLRIPHGYSISAQVWERAFAVNLKQNFVVLANC